MDNLAWLSLNYNKLKILRSGLLKNHEKLKYIKFSNNKITRIETSFENIRSLYIENNTCINKTFFPSDVNELSEMNAELKRLCWNNDFFTLLDSFRILMLKLDDNQK